MAKVTDYKASSYYVPAFQVGTICGLSKKRATAFACRIVDRAANGSADSFNTRTETGVWKKVKDTYSTMQAIGSERIEYGAIVYVPAQVVAFIVRTKETTWEAWERRAKLAGLI